MLEMNYNLIETVCGCKLFKSTLYFFHIFLQLHDKNHSIKLIWCKRNSLYYYQCCLIFKKKKNFLGLLDRKKKKTAFTLFTL